MKKSGLVFVVLLTVFLALWCLVAQFKNGLIPTPIAVVKAIAANPKALLINSAATLQQALVGLGISMLASAVLIITAAIVPAFERAVYPFVVMLKAVPALAFVPLISTMAGSGMFGRSLVAAIISFVPLAVTGLAGVHDIPDSLSVLRKNWVPSNWRYFQIVGWPYALRGYCLGLELAAPMSIVGSIVSDFVVGGNNEGLGMFITSANSTLAMNKVAAGGVVATVIGVGLFSIAHFALAYTRRRFHFER